MTNIEFKLNGQTINSNNLVDHITKLVSDKIESALDNIAEQKVNELKSGLNNNIYFPRKTSNSFVHKSNDFIIEKSPGMRVIKIISNNFNENSTKTHFLNFKKNENNNKPYFDSSNKVTGFLRKK